jgi:hypothetical protein
VLFARPSSSSTSETVAAIRSSTDSSVLHRFLKSRSMHAAVCGPKAGRQEMVGWCSASNGRDIFHDGGRGAPVGHPSSHVFVYQGAG